MKTVKVIYPDGSFVTFEKVKEVEVTENEIKTLMIVADYGKNYTSCMNFKLPLNYTEMQKFLDEIVSRLDNGFKVSIEYK